MLASQEPYQNGLLHGICRQWNEHGGVLGKSRITRGTGIQLAWHDNGQLQMEVSTVRGEFCGRNRIWLREGMLLSERFYLHGRVVSAYEYRAATTTAKTLPKFRGPPERNAANFVEQLYHAGAAKWIAPDIYHNEAGDQFADCVLVRLPNASAKRKAIRKVCAQLRRCAFGAMKPDDDIGEAYLYLYLS